MTESNIRKITAQDADSISRFYNADVNVYNWLSKLSAGSPVVGYVAEIDDKIVGAYIKKPYLLKIGDKKIVGYCGGPIVAKGYRGNWIYPKLTFKVFEEVRQLEGMVYGFPNRVITFLVKRTGVKFIKDIPEYVKIFTPRFLTKTKTKNKLLSKLLMPAAWLKLNFDSPYRIYDDGDMEIKKINQFDERINYFWEKVAPDYPIILIRDREYLNWRYVEEPHKQYTIFIAEKNGQILGYIILDIRRLQEDESHCAILDFLTIRDDAVVLKLLSFAINFLRNQKVDVVTCLTSHSYQAQALKKFGFVKGRYSKTLSAISYSPEVDVSFFLNPENWFITGGETRYA